MVKIIIKYDNWETLESIKNRLFNEYEESEFTNKTVKPEDITDEDTIEFFKMEVWDELCCIAEEARDGNCVDSDIHVEIVLEPFEERN